MKALAELLARRETRSTEYVWPVEPNARRKVRLPHPDVLDWLERLTRRRRKLEADQ